MAYLLRRHDHSATTDSGTSSSSMDMTFHTGTGDALWFDSWAPTSAASTFGACVGLFLLAVFGRLLVVVLHQLSVALSARSVDALEREYAHLLSASSGMSSTTSLQQQQAGDEAEVVEDGRAKENQISERGEYAFGTNGGRSNRKEITKRAKRRVLYAPPFIFGHEMAKATTLTVLVAVGYLLMLAVMTGNVYYFIAILLGVFAGEMSFGRYGMQHALH